MQPLNANDPRRIGPYEIDKCLGRGGMGSVYLGYAPNGREVAIKITLPELAGDSEYRLRFEREIEAAKKVDSLYTARVINHGLDPVQGLWYASEYVSGVTLDEKVRESGGKLDTHSLVALTHSLCRALAAIHRAGIVHRDLKPQNVIIDDHGHPCIVDFGIAHSDAYTRLTRTNQVIGTMAYMSPEQVDGKTPHASGDIFALGSLVTYAATGRPPFGEDTSCMYAIRHKEPKLNEVPDTLRPFIAGCLGKNPANRPSLQELKKHLPAEISPASHNAESTVVLPTREELPKTKLLPQPHGNTSVEPKTKVWPLALWISLIIAALVGVAALGEYTQKTDDPPPIPTANIPAAKFEVGELGKTFAPDDPAASIEVTEAKQKGHELVLSVTVTGDAKQRKTLVKNACIRTVNGDERLTYPRLDFTLHKSKEDNSIQRGTLSFLLLHPAKLTLVAECNEGEKVVTAELGVTTIDIVGMAWDDDNSVPILSTRTHLGDLTVTVPEYDNVDESKLCLKTADGSASPTVTLSVAEKYSFTELTFRGVKKGEIYASCTNSGGKVQYNGKGVDVP